jgi:hypothetical protein
VPHHTSAVALAPDPTRATQAKARRLVNAGSLAAPVLVTTWCLQALMRDGYDATRHPMSLLALGEGGFIQIANFVVTGLLVLLLSYSFRLLYTTGVGHRWVARLVQLTGMGLVAAGVFTADAGAGFPAGAPEGMPDFSVHGILHEISFAVVMLAWSATLFILYRRFRRESNLALQLATVAAFLIVLVLSVFPHESSFPVRTVLASGLQLAFVAAIARVQLTRMQPSPRP